MSNKVDLKDLPSPDKLATLEELPAPSELQAFDMPTPDSALKTFAKNALQTGTFDLGDELAAAVAHPAGAAKAIGNLFTEMPTNDADTQAYYQSKQEFLKNLEAGKEAHPVARWTGAAAGLIPAALTGGALLKGVGAVGSAVLPEAVTTIGAAQGAPAIARLAGFLGRSIPAGAAAGALQGAGEAERGQVGEQALKGAQVGAVLGPAVEAGAISAGKGVSALRKFSPHIDETINALERGLAGVNFANKEELEKAATKASQANTEEYNKAVKAVTNALKESKASAADLPVEEAVAPIKKGLEAQKSIKGITTAPEDLASTQAELANLKSSTSDIISSKKSKLADLKSQLDEIRAAKQSAQNQALLTPDESAAEKALSSMDSISQQESELTKQARDIQNSLQTDIAKLGDKSEILTKRAADLAEQVKNPPLEYPSEFKSDAAKLESIMSQIPRATAVTEGKIPASEIEQLLTSRIKELQSLGDNALNTANGRKIANEVRDLIRQHYTETAPDFAQLNQATADLLSAKGLMGGLEKTGDVAKDAAKQFKYIEGLLKTEKPGQAGMKAREMFGQADEKINNAIAQLEQTQSPDLQKLAGELKQYQTNRAGVTQSLEDVAMAQKLGNPNSPFYKTIAQKGANVSGLAINKSGISTLADALSNTANGQYLKQTAQQLRAKPSKTSQIAANFADQLADTQDVGKRRAIINVIQNSTALRQIFSGILGVQDGEQAQ